jgi:signal transduction histidine kinase
MMNLVPEWAIEHKEFWEAIHKRNLWFIKLRYGFVLVLFLFIILSVTVFKIDFDGIQLIAIPSIAASILVYNIILHRLRKYVKLEPGRFNPIYLSLLQMLLDSSTILLLVYFTGGIESPLYMLFVFHVIIGSLILPGAVVYSFAVVFIALFALLITLEHLGILPHHHINGLIDFDLYNNFYFVLAYLSTFTFMIFISVHLANGIARQLYKREKDLVESIKKINAAEKEKQKYIMGIVHELKTPIVAVASYIDLILQKFLGPIDETVEEKLVRAKNRTDEGIQMINDVLNVSKLTLYDQFDEEEVDINEVVSNVFKRRTAYADSHLIKMKLADERTKKEKIKGDKFLLDIAISNLLGNSIKYGIDDGRVEVTIKNDGGNVIVEVCDDGVGIPEDEMPKIFKDFYRAKNVKKITTEGSGLGLSVVKKIIDRHDGLINVESPSRMARQDRPGTCISVKLPFQRKEKE